MTDPSHPRRQPPSPLVFSPETVLPAIPLQSQASTSSSHASGANTVSMPFVRRHVYRRLKAAKQECDKELQRVTNSITAFFEERLRDNDHEQDFEREQRETNRERESRAGDIEPLREPFVLQPAALRSALQFDEVSSDGGYEAEPEGSTSRGRQRACIILLDHCLTLRTDPKFVTGLYVYSFDLVCLQPCVLQPGFTAPESHPSSREQVDHESRLFGGLGQSCDECNSPTGSCCDPP